MKVALVIVVVALSGVTCYSYFSNAINESITARYIAYSFPRGFANHTCPVLKLMNSVNGVKLSPSLVALIGTIFVFILILMVNPSYSLAALSFGLGVVINDAIDAASNGSLSCVDSVTLLGPGLDGVLNVINEVTTLGYQGLTQGLQELKSQEINGAAYELQQAKALIEYALIELPAGASIKQTYYRVQDSIQIAFAGSAVAACAYNATRPLIKLGRDIPQYLRPLITAVVGILSCIFGADLVRAGGYRVLDLLALNFNIFYGQADGLVYFTNLHRNVSSNYGYYGATCPPAYYGSIGVPLSQIE